MTEMNPFLNIAIFSIVFLTLSNWFQILNFSRLFIGKKIKTTTINDKWVKSVVFKKTGLHLIDITIFEDKRMYGMMAGLPFWPKMILSRGLYKNFNKSELEWVILHEAAHCILWHNLQAFLIEMSVMFLGIMIASDKNMTAIRLVLFAIFLSLITIQIIRWGIEYFADRYSINKVDSPHGVVTAQAKFRKNYHKNLFNDERSILRFLLHWNISATKRIKMANLRLSKT